MGRQSAAHSGKGTPIPRILIAGMGNVLRSDDGFGVAMANELANGQSLPDTVRVIEVGIGGVHLVQELMTGYDALIVLDAVERGSAPGTVHLLEASVEDLADWPEERRHDFLSDMHYTTPSRAMIMAKALSVLPAKVFILGCQPADAVALGIGLSEPVQNAIQPALLRLGQLIQELHRSA